MAWLYDHRALTASQMKPAPSSTKVDTTDNDVTMTEAHQSQEDNGEGPKDLQGGPMEIDPPSDPDVSAQQGSDDPADSLHPSTATFNAMDAAMNAKVVPLSSLYEHMLADMFDITLSGTPDAGPFESSLAMSADISKRNGARRNKRQRSLANDDDSPQHSGRRKKGKKEVTVEVGTLRNLRHPATNCLLTGESISQGRCQAANFRQLPIERHAHDIRTNASHVRGYCSSPCSRRTCPAPLYL